MSKLKQSLSIVRDELQVNSVLIDFRTKRVIIQAHLGNRVGETLQDVEEITGVAKKDEFDTIMATIEGSSNVVEALEAYLKKDLEEKHGLDEGTL